MPNCFQLLRAGVAVPLSQVDEEMCRHFNVPCDPELYFEDWYIRVGYDLAQGHSFDEIKTRSADSPILGQVIDWLAANFTVHSWYEMKSRPRDD